MNKKNLYIKSFCILCVSLFFTACSVKFDESPVVEDFIPEFIFNNTSVTRYVDKKPTIEVSAETIEKYKNSNETFASGVGFKSYNENGDVDTEGFCGYLYSDDSGDVYELFDGIEVNSISQETKFLAECLKWNTKNEQLIGGKDDLVQVEREGTTIQGVGFAASGVSKSFSFSGNVTGVIETNEDNK